MTARQPLLRTAHLACLVVVLACFSYPMTTPVLLAVGVPTSAGNAALKLLFLAIDVWLLWRVASTSTRLSAALLPLLAFLGLYAMRLVVDLMARGVTLAGYSSAYVGAYYFGLTIVPCLALALAHRHIDAALMHRWFLAALVIANLCLLLNLLGADVLDLTLLLAGRAQVEGEDQDTAVLSPLTYGLIGASLAAFALGRLGLMSWPGPLRILGLLLAIVLGLTNMMLGASRGPFFGFALCVLVVLAAVFAPGRSPRLPSRFAASAMVGLPLLGLAALAASSDKVPTFLFERLVTFAEDRSSGIKEERDYQQAGALQDFADAPLFGKQFVSTYDNFYPHNVPLEVLMATGLVGATVFAVATVVLTVACWRVLHRQRDTHAAPVVLVGFCHLFAGMTSGNIPTTPQYWIFFTLLTLLGFSPDKAVQRPSAEATLGCADGESSPISTRIP